ncbi:MAG: sn-glycerol-3-phosphate ABC transporter ATP-binding protein UgpC [bacterium]|nr:MAG: sn-glycerol-3-phosphate ABC transporter ATP-binding protein UgpC [bacterium]
MAEVTFTNVQKIYSGNIVAATDINLTIEDKELLVLVGPSGCGKSTVLRMVAGLEDTTEGEIRFDGTVVNDLPPKDRNVAMVFQNYALYPHMSVYDNMAFGLKLRKYPKDEIRTRVEEAAGILGIDGLLERKPKALSGGQRQRVALGRSIVRKPSVFLFDEPLSNLDAKMRVQMRTEIRKLNLKIQTTMIYVTHDQVEAMTLGDRLAVMHEGRILQVGTPLELYDRPAERFVAAFIGSPAMNFIEGEITGTEAPEVRTSFTGIPIPKRFSETLRGYSERSVTIGIRPEDIYLEKPEIPEVNLHACPAAVEVAEPLGNEIIFHLKCGDKEIVAREPSQTTYSVGDTVELFLNLDRIHLFESETGRSLAAS